MLYSKSIEFASGQSESTPTITRFKVNRGILYRVWIQFPAGCAGLTKLRIYLGGHPICPISKTETIRGDNYTFEFPLFYPIIVEPQQIQVVGWNEDDTYSHTIQIILLILPKKYVLPVGATEGIMESLSALIINQGEET